jgi:flagellar biogenesis protein FliO
MESLQQGVTVLLVLGLLGGTLFWLRSKGLARFGVKGIGRASGRQMQSIERLALTQQHSLHLVSVAGKLLLIAVSPAGCTVLDGGAPEVSADGRMVTR